MRDDFDYGGLSQRLVQPVLRAVFNYWVSRIDANGRLPTSHHLKFSEMGHLKSHLALVDVIREGADFRFRFGGQHIIKGYGLDLTGRTLSSLREGALKRTMLNTFNQVVRTLEPVQYGPRPSVRDGSVTLITEHIYLPLLNSGGRLEMILGGLIVLDEAQWDASLNVDDSAA